MHEVNLANLICTHGLVERNVHPIDAAVWPICSLIHILCGLKRVVLEVHFHIEIVVAAAQVIFAGSELEPKRRYDEAGSSAGTCECLIARQNGAPGWRGTRDSVWRMGRVCPLLEIRVACYSTLYCHRLVRIVFVPFCGNWRGSCLG